MVLKPHIPYERLEELAKGIRPIARFSTDGVFSKPVTQGIPFFVSLPDNLFLPISEWGKIEEPVEAFDVLGDIPTYHRLGYAPSIAEVITQIPEGIIEKVSGFETVFDSPSKHVIVDGEVLFCARTKLYANMPDQNPIESVGEILKLTSGSLDERVSTSIKQALQTLKQPEDIKAFYYGLAAHMKANPADFPVAAGEPFSYAAMLIRVESHGFGLEVNDLWRAADPRLGY
jgi:hypothetical protein